MCAGGASVAGERRRPTRAEPGCPPVDQQTLCAKLRELVATRLLLVVVRGEPEEVLLGDFDTVEVTAEDEQTVCGDREEKKGDQER